MGWGEAGQLAGAAGEGAIDGAIIAANEYTFGLIDPLDRTASQKVCEHGNWGKASKLFGGISRDAATLSVSSATCFSRVAMRSSLSLSWLYDFPAFPASSQVRNFLQHHLCLRPTR